MSRNVSRIIGCVVFAWMALASSSIAQAVTVMSMPDTAQGATGAIVQVPISAAPADGVFGIDMTVTYNPAVLQAQDVTVSGIAASAGFSLVKNLNTPGTIIISMFGPGDPLAGSGAIAQIQFHVLGAGSTTSALTFTSVVLNEGHIPVSLDNGLFTVPAPGALLSMPDNAQGSPGAVVQVPISVTPGDAIFGIDMTVTYNPAVLEAQNVTVSGIAASAGFSIVRNLNTPGTIIISMFAPGGPLVGSGVIAQIQFHVVGSQGTSSPLTFTSAAINEGGIPATFDNGLFSVPTVGAVLSMPDTAQGGPGAVVQVPISVTPGDGVLGVDMTVTYDPAVLTAQNVTVSGIGATAGFAVIRNLNTPGVIVITTYATGDALVGSGEFLRIQFLVLGSPGTTSNLTFTSASINEGQIPATIDNGLFTVTCAGQPDGTACNDGESVCTPTTDTCQSGVCVGAPINCNDSNPCTVDSCVPNSGCSNTPGNAGAECRVAAGICDVAELCTGTSSVCPADGFASTTVVCRADAGACDVAETCDGAGACPADSYEPSGTTCGSNSDSVCDNPDTCNATGSCQVNNEPTTVVCRADAGACDVAESCDGAGACPADSYEPSGTTCGSNSDSVCDNPDTCNATGSCQVNNEPTTVVCRADAGACDVAETCDGAGACPADSYEPSGTTCGSNSDTVCDNPDTCNATGSCQVNNEPTTVVCRADAGACDVAETCDGAGACPADSYEPSGTTCGSNSDTVCDNPDTCNATGSCQVNNEPTTVVCRADAGACDVAETCDGAGACPADSYEPSGTTCGSNSDTVCDNPDTCNATGSCQVNNEPTTVVCRADAGACDVAETCDGAGACPADSYEPSGTTCGSNSDTVCDNPDTCNATGSCQVNNEPTTVVCRADAGACDVAETCDGAGACPADSYEPSGTTCGSNSDSVCDNPDTCNATGSCQVNNEPTTVVCRADAGACDVAETCDGAGACPADSYEPSGTTCGSNSDSVCDNPDTCNATGSCQVNNEPTTVVCRADAGACDVAETCDGAGACPADSYEPSGTTCGSNSDTVCDNPDTCNATGSCQVNNEPTTVVCRADAGACDVAETCDGAGACPADSYEPSGTTCGSNSDTVCDNPDTCNATGSCQVNNEPTTVVCRADAGACDVAEICDGAGACPADSYEPSGTTCGSNSDTVCDNPDTCNATGACEVNNEPTTVVCRADAGACDVAESCDGAGACPADSYEPSGTTCGSNSDTVCDNPDTCNATGSCQVNNEPTTVVCRADAGACDVAETCDGAGACPADSYEPSGTTCGSNSDTVCDNPDTCNATGSCQVNNEPTTVVCRADAGACDVAETCDGAGACPADSYEPSGTTCGSNSDTVCDNPDTCNATGACQVNNEPTTVVCRADAGACDVAETCDGAGACPADSYEPSGTTCGSNSDTVCDNPDTCNATGACQVNNEPTTVVCRADAGACDVAETCDGAGACPADSYEPSGTTCGSNSDTVCDNPDTCNATGACQVNNEPTTVVCRADAGACDVAETCDGAGACPADSYEPSGTTCGSNSDSVCDNPDTCNATGSCQVNNEPTTVVCRADAGACDVAETCDGAGACPADSYEPSGTTCGSNSDSVCDNPDTCNATGSCQVNNEPTTVVCRADAGACDVAETCDGAGACPADSYEPSGTTCGSNSDSVCDNPDTCNATGSCQVNNEPTTVVCRADAGACDVAETCDGAGACPADSYEPSGTTCGSNSDSVCDNPDTCNATGSCQVNNEPTTVVCRADAGACDVAETCDGAGACPADSYEPSGTTCGSNSDTVCDNPDTCNATGSCQVNNEPTTVVCRADAGACDVAETCDGAGACPADILEPNGTSCNDNNATTCTDMCTSGTCAGTPVAEPLEIDGSLSIGKDVGGGADITWTDAPGPYNVYRGSNQAEVPWQYNQTCFVHETAAAGASDAANPPSDTLFYYLVSRVNACRESILGRDSNGVAIPNNNPCEIMP